MASNGSSKSQSKKSAERSALPSTKGAKRKVQAAAPEAGHGAAKERAAKERAAQEGAAEAELAAGDTWTLRLYVAGDSPKSRAAISNLKRLCEAHLAGKYEIEVIDLKTRPELAKAHQILALPTLIRKVPEPVKRVIGDLSNADRTLIGLEIAEA